MKLQDLPANAIFDQLAEGVIVADRKGAITYCPSSEHLAQLAA
ncbi:hypothetical protein [Qipengyuania citrea]|nr:hypothetical protein [Qipengyuania citrea]